jgi:hypothetical protein
VAFFTGLLYRKMVKRENCSARQPVLTSQTIRLELS